MTPDESKQFDELTGLQIIGSAHAYTKYVDPEAMKGLFMVFLSARQTRLLQTIEGMKKSCNNEVCRDPKCLLRSYNSCLSDLAEIIKREI